VIGPQRCLGYNEHELLFLIIIMTTKPRITVTTDVNVPADKAWHCWTTPECITQWNFASDDWHCPSAISDLKEGGIYKARMEAKDGSFGFDFEGTFSKIIPQKQIDLTFGDRSSTVTFDGHGDHTHITQTFDAESEHPEEMQRQGWQAILDNFKKHAEERHG
jgi:uncharacterized protein YndB with AHSA1/START domain